MTSERIKAVGESTPPLSIGFDIAIAMCRRADVLGHPYPSPELRVWLANQITIAVNAARSSSPTPDGVIKERGEDGRRPDGPGLSPSVGLASDPAGSAASIPGAEQPDLWCMHVVGPDDVHAAPDFWMALAWATEINAALGKRAVVENWAADEHMPHTYAVPARWPWSAELHAEDLAKGLAERKTHEARRRAAEAIEAGTAETEGLGPKAESAVANGEPPASIDQDHPAPRPSQREG